MLTYMLTFIALKMQNDIVTLPVHSRLIIVTGCEMRPAHNARIGW